MVEGGVDGGVEFGDGIVDGSSSVVVVVGFRGSKEIGRQFLYPCVAVPVLRVGKSRGEGGDVGEDFVIVAAITIAITIGGGGGGGVGKGLSKEG